MKPQSHPRLREALSKAGSKSLVKYLPHAFRLVVWELMNTQTRLTKVEGIMDKAMHQVTKRMKTAERDIKRGQKKAAVKVLKRAERKNEKLVRKDRDVRDPMIDKAKRVKKKFPKDWRKA